MNINVEFEKFTKEIYESLLRDEKITVEVKHNTKLKGRANMHQIDVYWTYEIAAITQKVAIECKLLNRKVSLGAVRDFYSVLTDLGNTNGIMVTNIGFQEGAKKFAEHYGINLFILNQEPNRTFIYNKLNREVLNIKFNFDNDWISQNNPKSINNQFKIMPDKIIIYDENDKKVASFYELEANLPKLVKWDKKKEKNIGENKIDICEYEFKNHFIHFGKYLKMKINSIVFTYKEYFVQLFETTINGEEVGKGILANVLSGNVIYFDTDGKPDK